MTAAAHAGSSGSHNNAPTITSEPRGSVTTPERQSSCFVRRFSRRSASVPPPRSGPPDVTRRVGSPPVWESMKCRIFMLTIVEIRTRPVLVPLSEFDADFGIDNVLLANLQAPG